MFNTIGFKLAQMARRNGRRSTFVYRHRPNYLTRKLISLSRQAVRNLK